jgi:Na+/H+ antiporter NhaD/arsenite permease-like protein
MMAGLIWLEAMRARRIAVSPIELVKVGAFTTVPALLVALAWLAAA